MAEGPAGGPRAGSRARAAAAHVAVAASLVLSLLSWTHFKPPDLSVDLDSSWRYAIDYAAEHHLRFGSDVVFTFGPLGSLYSDVRVQGRDQIYAVLSSALCVGLFAGFLLNASTGRRPYLLLLPVLLANLAVKDAALFAVPLSLALASCLGVRAGPVWAAGFPLLAAVDGLLPLVKGTSSVPVALCTALSCAALRRERPRLALALPAVTAASCALAWVAAGQALPDLPTYLRRQFQIAEGYTEAMSVWGNPLDLAVFVPAALLLAWLSSRAEPERRALRALAILGIAFVAFKAAFVRHDGHGFIAGSTLGFVGLLVFLRDDTWKGALGLAVGLTGWAVIAGAYVPADPPALLSTFGRALSASASGLGTRLAHPRDLFADHEAQRKRAEQEAELPRLDGTVDVYPTDIGAVLASRLAYRPRPVIQSYSAYTPALAALNAAHLEGPDAPENVLFNVGPIDDRYPNLEDGASWPALLSHYDLRPQVGPYAVLRRTAADYHARIGAPLSSATYPFDTPIPLPSAPYLWANFRFHPLKTGRLLSVVFKRPALSMDATFSTGERERFRMVAGMAEGFLLSPEIRFAEDFMRLASGDEAALRDREVRSVTLHQDSTYPFWGTTFDLVLAPLTFTPHGVKEP